MRKEGQLKNALSAAIPVYRSRNKHRFATESGGAKGNVPIVSNNIRPKAAKLIRHHAKEPSDDN